MATMDDVQRRLTELGIYKGKVDGIDGPLTKTAVRAFQRINGLRDDGIAGQKTMAALFPASIPERDEDITAHEQTPAQTNWPRQKECSNFYGPPGNPKCTAGKVTLPFSFRIAWNLNQRVNSFQCHEKVAVAMTRIFDHATRHYGEKHFRELGLDLFGGCYNLRKMRGGSNWSMHSWGIAVDLDPARNQLKWDHTRAQFAKPDYVPFWRIVEAEGAVSLGRARDFDWMHFQFARL